MIPPTNILLGNKKGKEGGVMFKVDQTRFGGKDTLLERRGNCFQACVAMALQIPLEEAFDHTFIEDDQWFGEFNKWLAQYGLGCIFLETSEEKPATCSEFLGIHIAELRSDTLYNGILHAVVMRGGDLLYDPLPNAQEQGKCQGVYIFVPLEAYRLVRTASMK